MMICSTITEAAEQAGCTPRSIYTWLREDPAFRSAYNEMKGARLRAVSDETAANAFAAINTLKEIMNDPEERAGARLTAARILLDNYVRMTELSDFEQRLTQIEETLAAK